jgi:hypothetical protein
MTVEFALFRIPRMMKELGYGDDYIVRWRHFLVDFKLIIDADNEIFMLVNPPELGISVRSKAGLFTDRSELLNEKQYEHRGKIEIHNETGDAISVYFIQVIPTHKKV